jgi:O-acetylhomoserine (thiol)-lyase
MAHQHGVPVIVDNTVATPILIRPIDYGADIVVHSLTKYMGGHGNSLGAPSSIPANSPGRPQRTLPHAQHPGSPVPRRGLHRGAGAAAYIARARTVPLRNTGSAISPFNAFLILQGIETLALRMERHCDNALAVARYLQ